MLVAVGVVDEPEGVQPIIPVDKVSPSSPFMTVRREIFCAVDSVEKGISKHSFFTKNGNLQAFLSSEKKDEMFRDVLHRLLLVQHFSDAYDFDTACFLRL